jgi:hypothetical protein
LARILSRDGFGRIFRLAGQHHAGMPTVLESMTLLSSREDAHSPECPMATPEDVGRLLG